MLNLGSYPGKKAPAIRLIPTRTDRVLELIAVLLWLAACVLILIPFFRGEVSDPMQWIFFILISTGLFALCFWMGYLPIRLINFPVPVHEGNVGYQYLYATRFGRVLNIILQLYAVSSAFSLANDYYQIPMNTIHLLFLGTTGLFVLSMVVYYIIAFRHR
ncbi:MAG: hypothetical protein LUE93_15320 [Bacteroides sp.]|nr:hypothetical protein [Bacteroides sp.]